MPSRSPDTTDTPIAAAPHASPDAGPELAAPSASRDANAAWEAFVLRPARETLAELPQQVLDPVLVARLVQRGKQPGIIGQGLARRIFAQASEMSTRLPLLGDVQRRQGVKAGFRAGQRPIVHVQSVRIPESGDSALLQSPGNPRIRPRAEKPVVARPVSAATVAGEGSSSGSASLPRQVSMPESRPLTSRLTPAQAIPQPAVVQARPLAGESLAGRSFSSGSRAPASTASPAAAATPAQRLQAQAMTEQTLLQALVSGASSGVSQAPQQSDPGPTTPAQRLRQQVPALPVLLPGRMPGRFANPGSAPTPRPVPLFGPPSPAGELPSLELAGSPSSMTSGMPLLPVELNPANPAVLPVVVADNASPARVPVPATVSASASPLTPAGTPPPASPGPAPRTSPSTALRPPLVHPRGEVQALPDEPLAVSPVSVASVPSPELMAPPLTPALSRPSPPTSPQALPRVPLRARPVSPSALQSAPAPAPLVYTASSQRGEEAPALDGSSSHPNASGLTGASATAPALTVPRVAAQAPQPARAAASQTPMPHPAPAAASVGMPFPGAASLTGPGFGAPNSSPSSLLAARASLPVSAGRPTGASIAQSFSESGAPAGDNAAQGTASGPMRPGQPRQTQGSPLETFTERDVNLLAERVQDRLLRQLERTRERQGWPR